MHSHTNIVRIRLIGLVKVQFETGRNKRARIINTKRNRKRFLLIIIMILEVTQTCIRIEERSIKRLNSDIWIYSSGKGVVPFTDRIIKYSLEPSAVWTSRPLVNISISNNSYSVNRNFFINIRINLQGTSGHRPTQIRCWWKSTCSGGKRIEPIPRIHILHGILLRKRCPCLKH